MEIVLLRNEHLELAAALVSRRYKRLRQQVPLLPVCYEQISTLGTFLENIMEVDAPGVAAFQEGRLVGFLKGWLMPDFRGKKSVYSPEWANGADLNRSGFIYQQMYRKIAAQWMDHEYSAHYISIFANDREAVRGWHWLGFGILGVDALRGLQPVEQVGLPIKIRKASLEDLDAVLSLHEGLRSFGRESPYFFISNKHSRTYYQDWLSAPDQLIWLAVLEGRAVAFLRVGPANEEAATIISDEGTISIYEVFTIESQRGRGILSALFAQAIQYALTRGYERCAVDFESMNILGTRFWFRHGFQPVSFALQRFIDERLF